MSFEIGDLNDSQESMMGIIQRVGAHEIDCEMILKGAHLLEIGVR